ncbi:hypothetical protein [Endozoicomonas sp. ONNA2]|uniref:hypothetical protein n=1 Tax=Endozoicomonas sp. ONNA2 TaxID=2828741 RepID=UPI002147FDDC|nr:hypothetical protein [Endozoicomonas sp. ONNA2]
MIPDEPAKTNAGNFTEAGNLSINGNGQALTLRMRYLEDVKIEDGNLMVASLKQHFYCERRFKTNSLRIIDSFFKGYLG